ncbi:MAG: hypothetical protein ACI8SE_000118 [Bacteroidia bacterium]
MSSRIAIPTFDTVSSSNTIHIYDALVASFPEVERKGKTLPYTSTNTYMFSFIGKEGNMALRLSSSDIEEMINQHDAGLMTQHGRIMKDFIPVPDDVLKNTELLELYFKKSLEQKNSLKPKKK